ncbi:uncharacterized protein LOC128671519 [Plodia interpunctella]|uniref:uncharacterized protein LOC128671519 n=1 Tax=Plodia interpunctella TaxID=58824 RepID=UPI0023679C2D|nr:uncharacterized protein LOC128671519 [Plodia interpunctella]
MASLNLASGDSDTKPSPRKDDIEKLPKVDQPRQKSSLDDQIFGEVTITNIDENELKLKERITQCRNIIESLKVELDQEKAKLKKESKSYHQEPSASVASQHNAPDSKMLEASTTNYSFYVENKLNYDENLMEYEKQLQKYQNTLNMAQLEKKNAIRKQMLAKAYRLKLMEVENQCNIELLRVKQSLQCLEPLQMIASKWKVNTADDYDLNNFELIPRYPELNMNSGNDFNTYKEDINSTIEDNSVVNKDNLNCTNS